MSNESENTKIWRTSGFTEEVWSNVSEGTELPEGGNLIIPLAGYLSLTGEKRAANKDRIGVSLASGDELAEILPHLESLPLIALDFPSFADGRSYSKAARLRDRYGYKGTLRATGNILIDQVELMVRTGFDELAISHEVTIARLEQGITGGVPYHTQPAQTGEQSSETYSWRRLPAA